MTEDAIARARAIAARLSAVASNEVPQASELGKRKSRWDDTGAISMPGLGSSKKKKLYIPVQDHPDINFLGLLIGPKGSTQKMLEERSGAKILIRGRGSQKDGAPSGHPDDDDQLHVSIEGSAEAVEAATREVERILFNPEEALRLKREQLRNLAETRGGGDGHYGPGGGQLIERPLGEDEDSVELKVPNGMVGLIIGKGGENIQRMQAQCGVHVQIAKESEMKPGDTHRSVILRGDPDGVREAKQRIDDMIDERLNRGRERKEKDSRSELAHLPFVLMIPVPNEKVGIVIGKNGATVKSIQDATDTVIKIPPAADENDPNTRTIAVGGTTKQATEAAHAEIWRIIQTQQNPNSLGPVMYMPIPDDKVGVVIGKSGSTIKDLQMRTGTRIQIPPAADPGSDPPVRTISVQGTQQAAFLARCEIETLLGLTPAGMDNGYGHYGAAAAAAAEPGPPSSYGGEPGSYVKDPYDYYGNPNGAATSAPEQAEQQFDPTAYYQQFWTYAAYYGEQAARLYYGQWSPPEGTPPPPGVVIPPPQAPAPGPPAEGAQPTDPSAAAQSAEAWASWNQYYQQQAPEDQLQQQQQYYPSEGGQQQSADVTAQSDANQEAWNQYYQQLQQYQASYPPAEEEEKTA